MRCARCGNLDDKVIDSRMSKDGGSIRRRRECLACNYRFTTYEEIERNDIQVVKRDDTRVPFDREKLVQSMVHACYKRPVGIEEIEKAANEITADLYSEGLKEVPSRMIGPKVMEKLGELDRVAYVRYASVYRRFEDLGEFLEEIETLSRKPAVDKNQTELFP